MRGEGTGAPFPGVAALERCQQITSTDHIDTGHDANIDTLAGPAASSLGLPDLPLFPPRGGRLWPAVGLDLDLGLDFDEGTGMRLLDPAFPVPAADQSIILATDGRRMQYRSFGPSNGFPVIALHGTPGSRLKFSVTDEHAHRLGLRIIAPDRWGYGGSDPHPAPELSAFAADIAALADGIGLTRFAVMGVSGGGPYATAVAALLPERVGALALVAPVGPIAGEPDGEIGAMHRFCFGPLARRRGATRLIFTGLRRLLRWSGPLGMRLAMARVAAADRLVLAHEGVSTRLAATFTEGLRAGAEGPSVDLWLFGRRWGLPLGNVRAPARLWIGTDDRNVPVSAAKRLASRIPGCVLAELPGQGHLWVALNYATVLGWIAENRDR